VNWDYPNDQLQSVAQHRGKTPYMLLSPYIDRISVMLAQNISTNSDVVTETMQFIGYSRRTFFDLTLRHTVPVLVIANNRSSLETIASIVSKPLGVLVLDFVAEILAKIYLSPAGIETGLSFVIDLLRGLTNVAITAATLMTLS
jgi:serine/threonine-protein kinase ATR